MGLVNGLLGALFFLTPWGASLEEDFGLGWLFQARGPLSPPEEVVLVTMDTESMKALGLERLHRKWPRDLHAQLIERLSKAGSKLIAFDIFFREERDPASDEILANAMRQAGNVLLVQEIRKDAQVLSTGRAAAFTETLLDPAPIFRDAAAALAPFTLPGVPVKVSQFWKFKPETGDTPTLPSIAFQYYALEAYGEFETLWSQNDDGYPRTAQEMLEQTGLVAYMRAKRAAFLKQPALRKNATRSSGSWLAATLAALYSGDHSQYLNYYGPPRTIKSISYHKVLQLSDEELSRFSGRAVFIGVAEAFQWDQTDTFYTVYSNSETGQNISGVEIAATAFANLLQGTRIAPVRPGQAFALLLLWGGLIGFLCRYLPAGRATITTVVLMLLYAVLAHARFAGANQRLPLVTPVFLQTLPVLFIGTLLSYREAHGQRANIAAALRRYLPPQVVEEAAEAIERIGGPGKTAYGVCLSTDGEQYTALAERLAPEQLSVFLNSYYEVLFEAIHRHGGTISDVVGDAVMALWLEPVSPQQAQVQACHAALDVMAVVEAFNQRHADCALPTRIGVHCGPLYIGDVGAGEHFEYRAVGDTVNTASRIEQANKVLGTRLLVSEEALAEVGDVVSRELGVFRLAGKTRAVRLFELVGRAQEISQADRSRVCEFAQALACFRRREWQRASELFAQLVQQQDDRASRYYLGLCERYRDRPPGEGWDGRTELVLQ